ncbi:hypothetical protein HK100_000004 [Physocladia obscura]|uniref:Uncharacterized protein n=1 Tax=Physocladia obscura TaxID=109957 RepID=A0AAD5TB40_9FUNG|nr:hypothetical protein HK100_000004 [Physocladia obscura]
MSGTTMHDSLKHLRADFLPTYTTDVLVWTPIQLINFRFIPVHFQPQFVNAFNIGWNAFLSYTKHEGSHYHAHAPGAEASVANNVSPAPTVKMELSSATDSFTQQSNPITHFNRFSNRLLRENSQAVD